MMLQTDSMDYHLITNGVNKVRLVQGMTCEIGLRRGGGSEFVMRALADTGQLDKTHIAIDPYGNIEFPMTERELARYDYTNTMRDETLPDMYKLANQLKVNFLFFNMEDTVFFEKFADGVPIYKEYRYDETQYAFVHFDGPHKLEAIVEEFKFFNERAPKGAVFVFDDVTDFYDHEALETKWLFPYGWSIYEKTRKKASYLKEES